jgi:hypothetical protein
MTQLTYAFTHHRVSLQVYRGRSRPLGATEKWFALRELPQVALAAPHARVIRQLIALRNNALAQCREANPRGRFCAASIAVNGI